MSCSMVSLLPICAFQYVVVYNSPQFSEILDFGYPQNSDVETLKLYITQGGIAVDKLAVLIFFLWSDAFLENQTFFLRHLDVYRRRAR